MIPFVIFCILARGPTSVLEIEEHVRLKPLSIWGKLKTVFMNGVYVTVLFAYALMIFTTGNISYYFGQYFEDVLQLSAKKAQLFVGISAMVAIIIGFLVSGRTLDFIKNQQGSLQARQVLSGVKLAMVCIIILTPLLVGIAFVAKDTRGFILVNLIKILIFICIGSFSCVIL